MRRSALPVSIAFALACVAACGGTSTVETPTTTTQMSAPDAHGVNEPEPVIDAGPADAGGCPPAAVVDTPGSWMPRRPPRNIAAACGAGQTLTVLTPCELGVGQCADFPSALAPCIYCLYGRESDATYGLRVNVAGLGDRLNVRGYALLAGATETCAEALEDYEGCAELACACAHEARKATCLAKTRTGACAARSAAVTSACSSGPSAAAATFVRQVIEAGHLATDAQALTMATAFCGGS